MYVSFTVAARSKTWTVFAHPNAGVVGSNRTTSMVVFAFITFMLSFVQIEAWRADPSSK
jgi:hypothetical protein